jgi:hypothetical protein
MLKRMIKARIFMRKATSGELCKHQAHLPLNTTTINKTLCQVSVQIKCGTTKT